MSSVGSLRIEPGPLADLTSGQGARVAAELDGLVAALPPLRALLVDAREGAGADEARPSTPSGLRDPAAVLAAFPAPTVAVCNGPAIGAGAELLLAADVRVIGPNATMVFPEVGRGELPCWGGTQRMTRLAGLAFALRAIVLGETLDADALERSGAVVLTADPVAAADELVARLSAGAPRAQAAARDAVQRGRDLTIADGHRLESDLNLLLSTTSDRAEGIAAFFDKRAPTFRGE